MHTERSKCVLRRVFDALESYYRSSFVHANEAHSYFTKVHPVRILYGWISAAAILRTTEIMVNCNFQRAKPMIRRYNLNSNLAVHSHCFIEITRLVQ